MKKSYTIYKSDLTAFIAEITEAQSKYNKFSNITTKPHKDKSKIIVVVG